MKSLVFCLLLFAINSHAQTVHINGKINAPLEVDGIHIINKTASKFSISNDNGAFVIPAKLNDTILFSGISYQPKEIIITKMMISSQQMHIYLEELVNALDEVVVGKILTGNLSSDIANADVKRDLDFYDLGIPGYTGKLKIQTERHLYAAQSGGGLIPIVPIINAISGRTKRLKEYVKFENLNTCLEKMKSDFSDDLFSDYHLEDGSKAAFFYYCQDDPGFEKFCKIENDLVVFEFLKSKLEAFKIMLQTQKP